MEGIFRLPVSDSKETFYQSREILPFEDKKACRGGIEFTGKVWKGAE